MKVKLDEKLTAREVLGIIMILLILKSTDTTPTLMFKAGYSAAWIIPIISGLLVMVPLFCTLSLLKAYKNKGFIEVVFHLFGKYLGTVIGLVIFYIIFAALIINSRSYVDIISSVFLPKSPINVLYAAIMVAACYIAWLGINAIGRTAWIFIPMMQVVTFLLVFLSQKSINLFFIFPIAGPGVIELLKSGLYNSTTWGDIFYLSIIFPMVKGYSEFKRANLMGYIISVVEFTAMMIVYIITFGYPSIIYLNYPLQELTRYAKLGGYLTHPESFFLGFWIISAVIRFSAQLYFSAASLSHTLKIKDQKPLIFPLTAAVIALGLLPENFIINIFQVRRELFDWSWPLVLSLPISLWVTAKIKGEL